MTRPDPTRIVLLAKPPCVCAEEAVCAKISVCSRRSFRRFIQFARPFLLHHIIPKALAGFSRVFFISPPPRALPPALKCLCCIFCMCPLLAIIAHALLSCVVSAVSWFPRNVQQQPLCITSFFPWFSFFARKNILQFDCPQQGFGLLFGEGRKEGRVSWSSWIRRESDSSKISPSAD